MKLVVSIAPLFVTSICLLATEAKAESVPTQERAYTEYVSNVVRRSVGDIAVTITGPLTLAIGPVQANLDRIYEFCRGNSTACKSEIDRYAIGVNDVLKEQSTSLNRDSIRLVVRTNAYLDSAQASLGDDGPTLQARPLMSGLVALAVLDTPNSIRPLDHRDLKTLTLSQSQLFALAGSNLIADLRPLAEIAKPVGVGEIGTITGSVYEVGRVALPNQWTSLATAQHGTLIIALPTTDTVLYVSESNPTAIGALRALTRKVATASSNPLSASTLLKWNRERWESVP